jgi:pyridoxine 4-dehydrogenase
MTTILGRQIGPVGFGLMGLTRPTGGPTFEESFAAMDAAFANGVKYWNGGEFYGTPERNTLHLLNEYFSAHPERASQIVLCIKGARVPGTLIFDGSEKGVRRSVDECVRVLDGKKSLDIFECARVDANVPIEETIRVLGELVKEGKIKGIGLSEVREDTIRRAAKVHPITQVEVELSLWSPDILYNGVARACAELGIPIIAYAPLSRGGLTTDLPEKTEDLPPHLQRFPRFQGDALQANRQLTKEVQKLAADKGVTVPQTAIGWVRAQSGRNGNGVIIPIPGAEKPEWVNENCKEVKLAEEDLQKLDEILARIPIQGGRYNEAEHKLSEG